MATVCGFASPPGSSTGRTNAPAEPAGALAFYALTLASGRVYSHVRKFFATHPVP